MAKYKEDLDLVATEPVGFKENEYTYVLGNKQKQMIIDAVEKEPFEVLKYYFLNKSSVKDDLEFMKKVFDEVWELQPKRGYQNLRIIVDNVLFTNHIVDNELLDKLVHSIDDLGEDLDLQPVGYNGWTLQEVYDEMGSSMFDDDNIPLLKSAGLIDEQSGYPIEEYERWDGEKAKSIMSLAELEHMDTDFIKSPYIRQLALNEIYNDLNKDENGDILINYKSDNLPKIRDVSEDFLAALFSEDAWEYFDWSDCSFSDTAYAIDDISSEILDLLESYGFPRDIYNQLKNGSEDEDSPLSDYYEDLKWAMVSAYRNGYEAGSAWAAVDDFNSAFEVSMPDGFKWIKAETTEDKRPILISKDYIDRELSEIWYFMEEYTDDISECAKAYFFEAINLNLQENFREPYYGWQEFDKEAFNDRLMDEILELDIPAKEAEKEKASGQMSLFDDNDNVKEDLNINNVAAPEIEIGPKLYGHTKEEVQNVIDEFWSDPMWGLYIYDPETDGWEFMFSNKKPLNPIFDAYKEVSVGDKGAAEILCMINPEDYPDYPDENMDATYVICGKYGPEYDDNND